MRTHFLAPWQLFWTVPFLGRLDDVLCNITNHRPISCFSKIHSLCDSTHPFYSTYCRNFTRPPVICLPLYTTLITHSLQHLNAIFPCNYHICRLFVLSCSAVSLACTCSNSQFQFLHLHILSPLFRSSKLYHIGFRLWKGLLVLWIEYISHPL